MPTQFQFKMPTVWWSLSFLLLSAVASFLWLDQHCNQWFSQDNIPGDVQATFQYIGAFGHGVGCLIAVLLIWNLDSTRRSGIKLVLGSTILAGIIATIMKVCFQRARPFWDSVEFGELSVHEAIFNNSFQSFPSGHAASAFSLAVVLAKLYPRGAKLFFAFAVITCFQRVFSMAHFPSDVCSGAIIGILAACVVLRLTDGCNLIDKQMK